MPSRPYDPITSKAVPIKFAGKWVAWTNDHSQIVAYANSLKELSQITHDLRIPDPIFEKVPRADVRLVGMR